MLLALLPALLLAQQLPPPVKARVDKVFAGFNKPGSPGCSLGIIRNGKLLYSRGYGYANIEHAIPIAADTVFDIGSTSKQFTAMAILLLEQDGKLSIDDDIRKHLPELPDYGTPVTIRQALNHTSGLRDYLTLFSLAFYGPDDFYTDDDVLAMLTRQKGLNFEPGSEHLYSNSGYFLMSTLVKRVSGKTLRQFAAERIFRPLGMTNTHFHDNHKELVAKRATGYRPRYDGKGFDIAMSTLDMVGDGGVHTSVNDLLKWDRNFYSHTVGGPELLAKMQIPGLSNYGLGLRMVPYRGLPTVSHGRSWAGYRAELLRFPTKETSVICLCNIATANPSGMAKLAAEAVLGMPEIVGPGLGPGMNGHGGSKPARPTAEFVGSYRSAELDVTYRLVATDSGGLRVDHRNGLTLNRINDDVFNSGPLIIRFTREGGRIAGFTLDVERIKNLNFERVEP
jgi:CubicO group peptidase (beta-lactamase class C family)